MKSTWRRQILLAGSLLLMAAQGLPALAQRGPAPSLSLSASVAPESVPFGQSVNFRLRVSNDTETPASFTVDPCPVHFRIDGVFSPSLTCTGTVKEVELEPGQSITFGPEDGIGLQFDQTDFPLEPGDHRVALAIRGIGTAEASFRVETPAMDRGYLAGRVQRRDDSPVAHGIVILSSGFPGSRRAADRDAGEIARARLTPRGSFFLKDLTPGTYLLRVSTEEPTLWYPGVFDRLLATWITVSGGELIEDLNLVLEPGASHSIEGMVNEIDAFGEPTPLGGAMVMAIPVWPETAHTAITDADGRFEMEVPENKYRLMAGKAAEHRYQYWDRSTRLDSATPMPTPAPERSHQPLRFDLKKLGDTDMAVLAGRVTAWDPNRDASPQPLAESEVMALPLLPSDQAEIVPHRTRTDSHGLFILEVPVDTPYLVMARREGYTSAYYPNASDRDGATWVDVSPGQKRDNLQFVLQANRSEVGSLGGHAFRHQPNQGCEGAEGDRCILPAAGALIRVTPAFPTFAPRDFRTRVNRDGSFVVSNLPADSKGELKYLVSVELENGEAAYHPGGVPFSSAIPISVLPGERTTLERLLLPLRRGIPMEGFIGGWVQSANEEPIENAMVRVYLDPERPNTRIAMTRTDREGYFLIKDLPVDTPVYISTSAEGWIPTYYPGVWQWADAEPVPTGSPRSRVEAVRFVLEPAALEGSYSQAARVTIGEAETTWGHDADSGRYLPLMENRFLSGAFVYLFDTNSRNAEKPVTGGVTRDNGSVVLERVRAGTYTAMADHPGFKTGFFLDAREDRPTPIPIHESTPAILIDVALLPLGSPQEDTPAVPGGSLITALSNAPNPFRPRTTIHYRLEAPAEVTVQIFDYRGRIVRTLVETESQDLGAQQMPWNGHGDDGKRVSSGVYFYRIQAGSTVVSRKMVVLP